MSHSRLPADDAARDAMARDAARRRRQRVLAILQWGFGAMAAVYLSLHAIVTWYAYLETGVGGAVLTLVTLGIGDLWWAVQAFRMGDRALLALTASAAGVAFLSWSTRGYVNAYLMKLAMADLDDLGVAIDRLGEAQQPDGEREDRR